MNSEHRERIRRRFYLENNQLRGGTACWTNLWWYLNDHKIGFGDLDQQDLDQIKIILEAGETFRGFNEYHETEWMRRENEVVRVTRNLIIFPESQPVTQETRAKFKKNK